MCGISGIIVKNGLLNFQSILEAMCTAQAHRGPEGKYYASLKKANFAYNRLSYVNIGSNHQPYVDEKNRCMVVFNGEIYNYLKLCFQLKPLYPDILIFSEAQVISLLYLTYGINFVDKLDGMFAIAIYDAINNELILCRDRYGKKPIYYYKNEKAVFFSSELIGLLQIPHEFLDISRQSLARYFFYNAIPAPYTLYKNIFKVRAGTVVIIKNTIQEITYWQPKFEIIRQKFSMRNLIDKVDALIHEAIEKRISQEVKQGVLLSGGLDSSLISAILSKKQASIETFNVKFEPSSYDETPYALSVAKHIGTKHHVVEISNSDLAKIVMKDLSLFKEPIADPSLLPTRVVCQYARNYVKGLFSGDGADELTIGYRIFQARKIFNLLSIFFNENILKKFLTCFSRLRSDKNLNFSFVASLLKRGIGIDEKYAYYLTTSAFNMEELSYLFLSDFHFQDNDIYQEIENFYENSNANSYLEKMQISMITHYLRDVILNKLDLASMSSSVEVRSPFLDRDLSDFLFQLPVHAKMHHFQLKYIIKKVSEKYLPTSIIYRKKLGFRSPIAQVLRMELRDYMQDILSNSILVKKGIFRKNYIQKLMHQHIVEKRDIHKKLWSLICLENSLQGVYR